MTVADGQPFAMTPLAASQARLAALGYHTVIVTVRGSAPDVVDVAFELTAAS